ncbi:uncharacterized protein LOC128232677 [Mya arenaria]|nr:uncharacterized protein LOC128232677 [Mya arenaria]
MDPFYKKVLQRNHTLLINDVNLRSTNILDLLREDSLLSSNEEETIMSERNTRTQNTKLLNILKKRDPSLKPYDRFKQALQNDYDFIVCRLEKSETDLIDAISSSEVENVCIHCQLTKNLMPSDISHTLYESEVLTDDDLDDLNNENVPRIERVNRLLRVLQGKRDQYGTLVHLKRSLSSKYKYLVRDSDSMDLNTYTLCKCPKTINQPNLIPHQTNVCTRTDLQFPSVHHNVFAQNLNDLSRTRFSVQKTHSSGEQRNISLEINTPVIRTECLENTEIDIANSSLTDNVPPFSDIQSLVTMEDSVRQRLITRKSIAHEQCCCEIICGNTIVSRGTAADRACECSWIGQFPDENKSITNEESVKFINMFREACNNEPSKNAFVEKQCPLDKVKQPCSNFKVFCKDNREHKKVKRKRSKTQAQALDFVDGNPDETKPNDSGSEKKSPTHELHLNNQKRLGELSIAQHVVRALPNNKRLLKKCSKLWDQLFFLREKGEWSTFNLVTKKAFEKFSDNPDIVVLLFRSEMCISTFYKNDQTKALEMFEKAMEHLPKTEMPNWHLTRILPLKVELCTRSNKFEEASSLLEDAKQAMQSLGPCLSTGAVYFFEAIYLGSILQCTRSDTKAAAGITQQVKQCFLTAIEHYQQEEVFAIKSFLNQVYLFLALFSLGVDFRKIKYIQLLDVKREDISLAEHYLNIFENNCWENSTTWSRMLFYIGRGEQHKQLTNLERSVDYFKQAKACSENGKFGEHVRFIETNIDALGAKLEERVQLQTLLAGSMTADEILQRLLESSSDSGTSS